LRQNKLKLLYEATVKRLQTLLQNTRDEYRRRAFATRNVILHPEENSFSIIQVSQLPQTLTADQCETSLVESLTLITIGLTSCQETKADVETYV
jgi:hypothetical protein